MLDGRSLMAIELFDTAARHGGLETGVELFRTRGKLGGTRGLVTYSPNRGAILLHGLFEAFGKRLYGCGRIS